MRTRAVCCAWSDVGISRFPNNVAEPVREPGSDEPRGNVGRAAWPRGSDDAHRPRRIGLRPRTDGLTSTTEASRRRSHGRNVAEKFKIKLVKKRCINRIGPSDQEQCVTVRRCTRDRFGGEIAARAGTILNDKLLSKTFRQPLTKNTRNNVRCAACWKPDDNAHRPRWIDLRPSGALHGRQLRSASGQPEGGNGPDPVPVACHEHQS